MDFTGPKQHWQIWIDVETLEPRDRQAGVEHEDFGLPDLIRVAHKAVRAVEGEDSRVTAVRLTVHPDEDER